MGGREDGDRFRLSRSSEIRHPDIGENEETKKTKDPMSQGGASPAICPGSEGGIGNAIDLWLAGSKVAER